MSTPLPSFPITPWLPHCFKARSTRKACGSTFQMLPEPNLILVPPRLPPSPSQHHLAPGLLQSPVVWPPSVANCHTTTSVASSPGALLTSPVWLPSTENRAQRRITATGPMCLCPCSPSCSPRPLLQPHSAPCQTINMPSTHHLRARSLTSSKSLLQCYLIGEAFPTMALSLRYLSLDLNCMRCFVSSLAVSYREQGSVLLAAVCPAPRAELSTP